MGSFLPDSWWNRSADDRLAEARRDLFRAKRDFELARDAFRVASVNAKTFTWLKDIAIADRGSKRARYLDAYERYLRARAHLDLVERIVREERDLASRFPHGSRGTSARERGGAVGLLEPDQVGDITRGRREEIESRLRPRLEGRRSIDLASPFGQRLLDELVDRTRRAVTELERDGSHENLVELLVEIDAAQPFGLPTERPNVMREAMAAARRATNALCERARRAHAVAPTETTGRDVARLQELLQHLGAD